MLPSIGETAVAVNEKLRCREYQVKQLAFLLSPSLPRPSNLVVHGLEATGKTSVVRELLIRNGSTSVIINCAECITVRHLLERTTADCVDAAAMAAGTSPDGDSIDRKRYARCETVSALNAHMQGLVDLLGPLVLVFDGIDRMRDATSALLPALARVAEAVPRLTIVYIIHLPGARLFGRSGIPHVHFPAYERAEALHIVSQNALPISSDDEELDESLLWPRFCAAVWDSLAKNAARDLVSFRTLAEKLWSPFVQPVRDGCLSARDFSKLMVANRVLFQSDESLTDRIYSQQSGTNATSGVREQRLPPVAIYALCAAYLASYNPPRLDQTFFMELSEKRKKRKGGAAGKPRGRKPKHRKIPRAALAPSRFKLARLAAIFSVIAPQSAVDAELLPAVRALAATRMLLCHGDDYVDPDARWSVAVGRERVVALGRSVGFEIGEWSAD